MVQAEGASPSTLWLAAALAAAELLASFDWYAHKGCETRSTTYGVFGTAFGVPHGGRVHRTRALWKPSAAQAAAREWQE